MTLPTDGFVEPTDLEYYLIGTSAYYDPELVVPNSDKRSQRTPKPPSSQGGSEGQFGHSL